MNVRKSTLVIMLLVISLLVAGCGGTAQSASTDTAATQNASSGLNQATKLVLGILKLEDSDQAVTIEQAQELLTLWQAYQALGNSETTAAVEMEALVNQIESSLTTKQVEAIDSMSLTSESMAEVMQGLGMEFGPAAMPGLEGTPQPGDAEGFQTGTMPELPAGGFPGGGQGGVIVGGGNFPGGGMRIQGGGGRLGDDGMAGIMGAQGTPGAMNQNRFSSLGSQVNPMLLRMIISFLETKIGAVTP